MGNMASGKLYNESALLHKLHGECLGEILKVGPPYIAWSPFLSAAL